MKKVFFSLAAVVLLVVACEKDDSPKTKVLTFEQQSAYYLAGPTAYGENLYDGYTDNAPARYFNYTDPTTCLEVRINPDDAGVSNYWNGGVAVSQWKDKTVADQMNQCSVYADGGADGSATFGVANIDTYYGYATTVYFSDSTEEHSFKSIAVANSAYTALTMLNGNAFSKKFSYDDKDWFMLTITGYTKKVKKGSEDTDSATGSVTVYLADFRTADAPGVLDGWTNVDLSSIGKANYLKFDLTSSDTGTWGMNTPAYFCFDNLTFVND